MRLLMAMIFCLFAVASATAQETGAYTPKKIVNVAPECGEQFELPEERKGILVGIFLPRTAAKNPKSFLVNFKLGVIMDRADAVNPAFAEFITARIRMRSEAQVCEWKHEGKQIRAPGVLFHLEARKSHNSEYFATGVFLPKEGLEIETVLDGVKYVGEWQSKYKYPDGHAGAAVFLKPLH